MSRLNLISEDLRKIGLILIAAALVVGFLREQLSTGVAIVAAFSGLSFNAVGYLLHRPEEK